MHLGIIGFGNIASALIDLLATVPVASVTVLVRPASRTRAKDQLATRGGAVPVKVVTTLEALIKSGPDLVVECAGHGAVDAFGPDILRNGTDLIIASVGALADEALHQRIYNAAKEGPARVILPSGAIGGLDLLSSLALAGEVSVVYTGTKPADAWRGTSAEDLIDLDTLTEATTFFKGTAREAALAFPKNANVVAALALAGGGFDAVQVGLVADPAANGNRHAYTVVSPHCRYTVEIDNVASQGNARTSTSTIYSLLAEIRNVAGYRDADKQG